jgi:hypothetical protein
MLRRRPSRGGLVLSRPSQQPCVWPSPPPHRRRRLTAAERGWMGEKGGTGSGRGTKGTQAGAPASCCRSRSPPVATLPGTLVRPVVRSFVRSTRTRTGASDHRPTVSRSFARQLNGPWRTPRGRRKGSPLPGPAGAAGARPGEKKIQPAGDPLGLPPLAEDDAAAACRRLRAR